MANLTPITQGMQNGAQAINENFNTILKSNAPYVRISIDTTDPWISDGSLIFERSGNVVVVTGSFKLKQAWYTGTTMHVMPSGLTPTSTPRFAILGTNSMGYINGSKMTSLNDIAAGTWVTICFSYITNDDFPS